MPDFDPRISLFEPFPSFPQTYPIEIEQLDLLELFQKNRIILNKLKEKPKILKQITLLNSKINKIEKALQTSSQKVEQLEGGKAARLPIIGTLIKFFCKWYNSKLIEHEQSKSDLFKAKEAQYKQDIKTLRKSLPTDTELPATIFEIEYQMQVDLERDFPEKAKYQAIYDQHILPLVQQAKQAIIRSPFHFAIQAAAAKGRAAQAGLRALKKLAENRPLIQESGVSSQQVFLLPEEGAVFKHSSERAKEEEALVNALFDLMSKQAIVGAFNIQNTSLRKFGIQLSSEVLARGFSFETLSSALCAKIKQKLSKQDRLVLEKYEKVSPKKDSDLINYQQMKSQQWYIQLPEQEARWGVISFKELQKLNLTWELSCSALIGSSPERAISLQEHLLSGDGKGTPFARALNYFPSLHAASQLYLSPDLSDPDDKHAYQLCEQFKWSYFDPAGARQEVDFKALHALSLQKEPMLNIQPITTANSSPTPASLHLHKALNVAWKTISPELMQLEAGSVSELTDIQAKPFVKEMILMKNLTADVKKLILKRLTPNAEFNAILTGEVQLLDLHSGNLGLAPESNAEYEYFKDLKFMLPVGTHNFRDLITTYLAGKITPETLIQFENRGVTIQKPLRDLPDLQKALDARWELVIFDTELSLSDDNRLQLQTYQGVEQHLIPFRSALLETEWKDKPLSEETIEHLMNSEERDLRVKQWIKKGDAHIYKQLSPAVRESIEQQIAPFIQKYNLSEPRKKDKNKVVTVKSLQTQFVDEISNPHLSVHAKIWKTLEQDLSSVIVHSNDTWEKIAIRHKQHVEELQHLNPGDLVAGKKIKIHYDLTSDSPKAMQKRKQIAAQLFPRLTYCQQTALLQRQQNRKKYLNNYHKLSHSTLKDKKLLIQMEKFVQEPSTPLSSIRKEEVLQQLKDQKNLLLANPQKMLNLKQAICQECQPSYFNLMKAMYPLLADAFALNKALYKDEAEAGKKIGLYSQSLEEILKDAYWLFNRASPEARLAQRLEGQIASIKNPAFFDHWG